MDVDSKRRRRDRTISRETRWSMNSQRLEEIVAELMKPINDARRSFDTDLSALLEEYLTEAGLHALDAAEQSEAPHDGAPNFAEIALLLQQSASIYGRKVDFLYRHVVDMSDSLHASAQEDEPAGEAGETGEAGAAGRRRRRHSAGGEFAPVELQACGASRRVVSVSERPPPTLPRLYLELEPRAAPPPAAALLDYGGDPVGHLDDFHVVWRLQEGMLVEELQTRRDTAALRPLDLLELRAQLEAAAPPPLRSPRAPRSPSPHPSPPPSPPLHASTPLPPADVLRKERKRKRETVDAAPAGGCRLRLDAEWRVWCGERREFGVSGEWRDHVVRQRARVLRDRRLRDRRLTDFRGFERSLPVDIGGFAGWSFETGLQALQEARTVAERLAAGHCGRTVTVTAVSAVTVSAATDSDDDGFYEQSSLGESDGSRVDDTLASCSETWVTVTGGAGGGGGGALDVRQLGERVLRAVEGAEGAEGRPFGELLRAAAADRPDVSRLFLATLFLANAGRVEIVRGAPLSPGAFSVRAAPEPEPEPEQTVSAECR